MPKTTIKDPLGNLVEATSVGIKESREYFNELTLDDGTILKMKVVATQAYRLDGKWDNQGNPVYVVNSSSILVVDSAQEILRQGASNDPIRH